MYVCKEDTFEADKMYTPVELDLVMNRFLFVNIR